MALFDTASLNPGVRKREVFGWAMYDFANSGYTTVVMTAVFNAYFVGVVAANASWATLAWTSALALSSAVVMLTMPSLGALADLRANKKRLLAFSTAGCVLFTALLALAGPGDLWLADRRHRAVEHLLQLRRIAERGLPARAGAARCAGPRVRLGLELRLLRRHAHAGPVAGLCAVGAGAGHVRGAVRAGDHAHHRRRSMRWPRC